MIVYIGIACMLIFILINGIDLKKILNKKLELKEIDHHFLNRMNKGGE